jgi:uncharacterized protein YegL
MHGSMEFFKISLYNVLRNKKRKIKLVDFVVKDLQKLQFSDNEKFAVKALKVIEFYRDKDLIEDVITTRTEQGNILNVIYNNRHQDNDNVVLITENKDQASKIVNSLSDKDEVDFGHSIAAVRLIKGPALWDVKTVKPRVMPIGKDPRYDYSKGFGFKEEKPKVVQEVVKPKQEEVRPVQEEKVVETPKTEVTPQTTSPEPAMKEKVDSPTPPRKKRNKLVVSIVLDNSSSLTDEREAHLKQALEHFNNRLLASDIKDDLDVAIYGFDGFSPRVIKDYDTELNINKFDNGGIQVLGKAIDKGMLDLAERQRLYQSHNVETHKPWLIVLADGSAYGDLSETANKLKQVLKQRKLTYFPFSLNAGAFDETLNPLLKLKMFLKVKDDMFTELFDFLFNTLETRINTPKDDLMTLDRKAISGFIAR